MEEIKVESPRNLGEVVVTIKHRRDALVSLHTKVSRRKSAHKDNKDVNKLFDNILKCTTLFSSTATTYFVTSQNIGEIPKIFTFITTISAGLQAMFNNTSRGEEHHTLSRNYDKLGEKINTHILNEHFDMSTYEECNQKYIEIHSNPLGLFPWIRKKHNIT